MMSRRPTAEFTSQPHKRAQGRVGEEEAHRYLKSRGYQVLATNFQTRVGEIDLIALDGDTLCFVEVKARTHADFGGGLAAVTRTKQRRLSRAAQFYLLGHPHPGACRFDVLALDARQDAWQFTLVQNAFEVVG